MTTSTTNKKDWKEKEENKKAEEPMPQEWVCLRKCYCSEDGNPLRRRIWNVGETVWSVNAPSKHFVTRHEYDNGADGKAVYFQKITKYGGRVTEKIKRLEIPALKVYARELERSFLRRQATK